ncbi:MFS transporter, partial [Candidatus Symbiopectobacterium sp. NZEC135]|uniref:MFS transporter n=1 Tax=Candidatus Symbiopectobacterium sp. NZEC135 TaxID=2820471 RepID=UPI002225BAEF
RPRGAACKLGALSTGAMIGGGAFVALFHTYGWKVIFLCYAASLLLLVLPVLLLMKEVPHAGPLNATRRNAASLSALLRNPVQRKRLTLLTLTCCVIFPIAGLNRLMLLDLNVPIEQIGGIVGTLGPISMLLTAVISMPLMRRAGLSGALMAFTSLALLALAAMTIGFVLGQPWLAMAGAIAVGAAVSGIFVALSARILGWSRGAQPATDYAAFYGV